MKNLTLRVDEDTLRKARAEASRQSTSVNALVREFLDQLAQSADRQKAARERMLEIAEQSTADSQGWKWNRDSLYER